MSTLFSAFRGSTAVLAVVAFVLMTALASAQSTAPEKKYKDDGEYQIFDAVVKDVAANNFTKALADLETWTQKYSQTEFATERDYYYLRAYAGASQPAKVLEVASLLLSRNVQAAFAPYDALNVYALTAFSIRQLPNATPDQIATGARAAREGLEFIPTYFVAANKPAAASDDQWTEARSKVENDMRQALLFTALLPGSQAQARKEFEAAEQVYSQALRQFPESPQVAFALGGVLIAQSQSNPEKVPLGIYQVARAAALDPGKWGAEAAATNKAAAAYLDKVYTQYHGPDPAGLQKLKELAALSPLPPEDFKIKTQAEIDAEKEAELERSNPQFAVWKKIKGALSDTSGGQYYESEMKGTLIAGQNGARALKGTLLEARPACRSTELVVAVSDSVHPEVTLKLETALAGKPRPGTEIQFDGAPSAFAADPFMLTMDTETQKIDGLVMDPCQVAPKPGVRKGAPAKKK